MKSSMDSVLSRRTPRLLTVRERDCGIAKLNDVDGNQAHFLSCSDEHRFRLFTIYLKFVLCHPVFDVQITVSCGFHKSVDVSGKALLSS